MDESAGEGRPVGLVVRPARPDEARTIRRLVWNERLDPTGLDWRNFLVAELAGRVVGCGQVRRLPGARELGSLVVVPEQRGRGIGAALVRALVERSPGALYLFCRAELEPYYARFGFRRAGLRDLPVALRLKYVLLRLLGAALRRRMSALRRP
jgi:N-acetylglutamate synthase-like GNAT family acetyltransferase